MKQLLSDNNDIIESVNETLGNVSLNGISNIIDQFEQTHMTRIRNMLRFGAITPEQQRIQQRIYSCCLNIIQRWIIEEIDSVCNEYKSKKDTNDDDDDENIMQYINKIDMNEVENKHTLNLAENRYTIDGEIAFMLLKSIVAGKNKANIKNLIIDCVLNEECSVISLARCFNHPLIGFRLLNWNNTVNNLKFTIETALFDDNNSNNNNDNDNDNDNANGDEQDIGIDDRENIGNWPQWQKTFIKMVKDIFEYFNNLNCLTFDIILNISIPATRTTRTTGIESDIYSDSDSSTNFDTYRRYCRYTIDKWFELFCSEFTSNINKMIDHFLE